MRLIMGRKRGEIKETVTIRLTPKARLLISDLKKRFQQLAAMGSGRQYTNSMIIEQAIGYYFNCKNTDFMTDFKMCGACGQPRDNLK
jgi:predicted transcriptional regulator